MNSELTSSNGVRLILVPPGSFIMGSPPDEIGHEIWEQEREVTLHSELYLGATPVTQQQFRQVTGKSPTDHPGPVEDAPVDTMGGYHDGGQAVIDFCAKLTEIDRAAGILSGYWEYRLPTETEWEYACRAGTSGPTYGPLDSIAWHSGNSDHRPHPVCQKSPNPWGFHDMLGNVWELCQDWYAVKRPAGSAKLRACRGGSYFNTRKRCRAAARYFYTGGRYCGFRLAAAPIGQFAAFPPIEEYPAPPATPSLWDALDAKDYRLAEQILADDPEQLEGVDDIPPSMHGCIYEDKPEMFEWFLDHGANIELREQDYGSTPLKAAIIHRHKQIIRILVERGANTAGALHLAERGLAGDFEDLPPPEAYREIIALLRDVGVK